MELPFPARCAEAFEPVRLLASGGMGVVWLAIQRSIKRNVVIKLLRPECLENAEQVERFLNEAQITAQLRHECIVTIVDSGVDDGIPWIVYEHVPGGSLRDHLQRGGPFSWKQAAKLGLDVARALSH